MGNVILDNIEIREFPELKAYQFDAPTGTWSGVLDCLAWGRSNNLFVYFTNIETREKYRLSTFSRKQYCPYDSGPSFRYEKLKTAYQIETSLSRNGLPKLLSATPLDIEIEKLTCGPAFRIAATP